MPLANTRMFHPQWAARNARVALGGMQARIQLSRPEQPGIRDPVSGKTPMLPGRIYYEGPGRLQNRGAANPSGSGAGVLAATGNFLLAVPLDLDEDPALDDLVDVVYSPDAMQTGLRLHVVDVPTATQVLQRNLGCDLYRPTLRG